MVIAFLEVVVFYLELIALKAGGNPVGGSNDPLQKGLRFVMSRCGIDGGVRELAIACRYLERFAVTLQIGKMSCFLQFIPRDAGISRMQMTEPSARISKFLVMRAIELLVAVQRVRADLNFGSFGQFAQVVQEATECHAGSCVKHIRFTFKDFIQNSRVNPRNQRWQACHSTLEQLSRALLPMRSLP